MRGGARHVAGLEEAATRGASPLHRADPRVKLALTVLACAALATAPRLAPLGALLVAAPGFAALAFARPPGRAVLAALAVAAPFTLAFVVAAPFLEAGTPVARGAVLGVDVAVTREGLLLAATLLGKLLGALAATLALVASTPLPRIAAALAWLRLPRLLVAVLLLTWRYLFVLVEEGARMLRARRCRAPGRRVGVREAGRLLGVLLSRALQRAERIHRAMLARGFRGTLPTLEALSLRRSDALGGALAVSVLAGAWVAARALASPGGLP